MKSIQTVMYLIGVSVLAASCFPKASEAIRALPISSRTQIVQEFNEEEIREGESIFATKCVKCHSRKDPEARTAEQWNPILKRMIPRAKLSDEQGKLVWAYVVAHSKES